ncbi:hypothetical protein SAMN06265348_102354 [Pedobacter westerhofensis]|uniref:Uncharacterized protein n=1 Tax=Pedobacter westerhofensis TaxID=425512 RepID=A0A521BJJ6_9SPHI|nr:DUF6266 family protein [Pedobacter westerhofensis]SMO47314.1 hypothetical protein SAMN06265348_102354 [Pedobacter westerhofensis]
MKKIKKKKVPGITWRKGNNVRYFLNGELVERTIGITIKEPTQLQKTGRQAMKVVVGLLKPVKEFIEIGFNLEKKEPHDNAHNLARSTNKLNAIRGEYPNVQIDFEKALFSKGILPVNPEAKVQLVEKGLEFTWDPAFMEEGMWPNDQAMMLAYCDEKESAFFEIAGMRRSEGKDFLEITPYHQPVTLEVYLSFVAADRKSISNSVYLGQVKY